MTRRQQRVRVHPMLQDRPRHSNHPSNDVSLTHSQHRQTGKLHLPHSSRSRRAPGSSTIMDESTAAADLSSLPQLNLTTTSFHSQGGNGTRGPMKPAWQEQERLDAIKEHRFLRREGLNTQGHRRRLTSRPSGMEQQQVMSSQAHYRKFIDKNLQILISGSSSKYDKNLAEAKKLYSPISTVSHPKKRNRRQRTLII